ncbi:MAG: EAL domain-containing protein [Methylococcales bacterium]|nr:EAL domain-containing protein [Methylococcales bacterium]
MREQETVDVLFVEDNQGDARLLEIMLSEIQPNPVFLHHAASLSQALGLLQTKKIDLILLDLALPDADGLECLKKIQQNNQSVAIIILTGLDDLDFAKKTMQHGAQDYLVKGQGDGHLILRAIHYAIERKQIEQRLTKLAHFDSLTGLANREYFNLTLTRAIQQAERKKQMIALMFLDLDYFKDINDTLGHAAGDQLLISVAKILISCVRSIDFIARLGGDEFVIILDDICNAKVISRIAEKILSELAKPITLSKQEIVVSSSIGVSVYPDDAINTNDLVRFADSAMYQAKDKGRNNFQFYTRKLNEDAQYALMLKNDLRSSICRNELMLYYQPKINILSNKIIGAEALLRWKHPTRNMVSPEEFIPLAEQSSLILVLGKWVISEAIKQNKKWQEKFERNFCISINLSVKQFKNRETIDFIDAEIALASIEASTIEFEITENLLMGKTLQEKDILRELSERGYKIAIDDFGTGYSSLAYLKHFSIDTLKIDKSFIRDINSNSKDAEIVKAIIAIAHALKLDVIAEGVENEKQMALLKMFDCDEIQGFLFSKPVPAHEFERLMEQQFV